MVGVSVDKVKLLFTLSWSAKNEDGWGDRSHVGCRCVVRSEGSVVMKPRSASDREAKYHGGVTQSIRNVPFAGWRGVPYAYDSTENPFEVVVAVEDVRKTKVGNCRLLGGCNLGNFERDAHDPTTA